MISLLTINVRGVSNKHCLLPFFIFITYHNEPSHLDLQCLPSSLLIFNTIQFELNINLSSAFLAFYVLLFQSVMVCLVQEMAVCLHQMSRRHLVRWLCIAVTMVTT